MMDIVEELRRDRESGAKRLVCEYKAGLMSIARRFFTNESDAEELVNATFAKAVDNIDGYLEKSAFFAWLCQILNNEFRNSVKRKSNRNEICPGDVPEPEDENARDEIYENLDATLLRTAIAELNPEQREVIVLRYFEDLPIEKIAKFLTLPAGTVRSRLFYARKALAARLGAGVKKAVRKPGGKALLLALALAALTAAGAASSLAVVRLLSPHRAAQEQQAANSKDAAAQDRTGGTEGAEGTGDASAADAAPDPPVPSLFETDSHAIQTPQTETTMNTTKLLAGPLAALALAAPTANLADTPSSDTIAYWPFGENGFSDVSGNGHDLASTTVTESDAGYITLDGTSQFLTTASALDLSDETAVTFECWTRSTGKKSNYGVLFSTPAPAGTSAGSFVLYYTGRLQSQFGMGTGWQTDYTESQSAMDDGAWHHVAYVIDSSQTGENATRLYLDGVQMKNAGGQTGAVPALLSGVLHIGGGSGYVQGNNFFTGYIDDVRISRGALTPDQFLKFPSVGKAMRADDGSLPVIAHWPFGGKGGRDASGNGFDLVMSNVLFKAGTPYTSWSTQTGKFACSPNQTIPFSAFSNTGLTIEMFVMAQSSSTNMAMILESSKSYWSYKGSFRISYDANPDGYRTISTTFHINSDKSAGSATSEATFGNLGDNKWRHIAIVYDPSKTGAGIVTLYVDGVPGTCSAANANQGAFALGDLPLYFFRRANSQIGDERTALPFYGSIDDVRITGCALTPDQFLSSRSAASAVALYRFDRETIADQSGNGNDLVLKNGIETGEGTPTFGDNGSPASGTGLVLTGKNGGKEWARTANDIDFSGTKSMTIEVDYVCPNPKTEDSSSVYVFAASTNATSRGGFVMYRSQNTFNGQFRQGANGWLSAKGGALGTATASGYRRGRYVVNANNTAGNNKVYFTLTVDGTAYTETQSDTFDSLGKLGLSFGHCPVYYGGTSSEPCYMKGKLLRVAVSDIALDTADYVLDNLVLDTPKATLAYWSFAGDAGLTTTGAPRRNGALDLDGSSPVTTTNLTLSALTQATIECFVTFGATPSSGTLFSMGSGAGSFSVAADATAGTLSGSFIPYDHLAAANGGATALAPLAGKKVWHHVALVIDRTKPGADAVRFYVDYGRTTPAGRAWDAAATLLDGAIVIGEGFTGRIDDLRVSAGALEPNEFLQPGARTETPDAFTIIIR